MQIAESEIWYDIPGYKGYYQYSNLLRIRSISRLSNARGSTKKQINGRVLKIILPFNKKGERLYAVVSLSKNGVRYSLCVHKFFAEMHIPNPDNKPVVNHKNGNKHDYELINLEWATKSEDIKHAYDTGLRTRTKKKGKIGRSNPSARKVIDIPTGRVWDFISDASRELKIPYATLHKQLTGVAKNKTTLRLA